MSRKRLAFLTLLLFTLTACGLFQKIGPQDSTVSAQPTSLPSITAVHTLPAERPQAVEPGKKNAPSESKSTIQVGAVPDWIDANNPGAPDIADYAIAVTLDPTSHQLAGKERVIYHNETKTPIPDLVFHLYLNAFRGPDTIFMRESGGQLRGDEFNPQNNGWIEVDAIQLQGGQDLKLEPQQDGTLARSALPAPVQPGESITLEVSFHAQLPQVFARTGWALDEKGDPFFLVGQWFPKLGVWTEKGWNAYPFHGNSEFFADFGRYTVAITLPSDYKTGATGLPDKTVQNADGTQTVTYAAAGVIDFAWVASPNLETASRKTGSTEIVYTYLPEHAWSVDQALEDGVTAVEQFGRWFGPYPYARLTLVDVPDAGAGAGGMEYPTFVTLGAGSPDSRSKGWSDRLEIVTVHEIAHQWWQSMVATNEAEEPWLDEGFADYSSMRLLKTQYGLKAADFENNFGPGLLYSRRKSYLNHSDVPMAGKAWDFSDWGVYTAAVYAKPSLGLLTLENELGEDTMLKVMSTYFNRYHFAHPTTADFRKIAEEVTGQDLGWFFDGLVYGKGTLNYVAKSIDGSAITVDREGSAAVPTDIQVVFSDGTRQTVEWNGQPGGPSGEQKFSFQKPVKSFDIDPQHKLFIELDWTDNQLTR